MAELAPTNIGLGSMMDRERGIVRSLVSLSAERARAESDCQRKHQTARTTQERAHAETVASIETRLANQTKAATDEFQQAKRSTESRHHAERTAADREYEKAKETVIERASAAEKAAKATMNEAVWVAESVYEASEHQPKSLFEQTRKQIDQQLSQIKSAHQTALELTRRYRQKPPSLDSSTSAIEESGDPRPLLTSALELAQAQVERLARLRNARLFEGALYPLLAILLPAGAAGVAYWQLGPSALVWIALCGVGALLLTLAGIFGLYVLARRQVRSVWMPLLQAIERAQLAHKAALQAAGELRLAQEKELVETRDRNILEAREAFRTKPDEIREQRERRLERVNERYALLVKEIQERRDTGLAAAEREHGQAQDAANRAHKESLASELASNAARIAEIEAARAVQWTDLKRCWIDGMTRVMAEVADITGQCDRLFPPFDAPTWSNWKPPDSFAPVVRFGASAIDLTSIPGGLSESPELAIDGPTSIELPAVLELPDRCSLLLEAASEARERAIQTIQATMLRLLTSLPPGKVRFTIIDPVGLGQNFAGFMHLADDDESLVGSRIWTEARHIEQRLTDLTEHMENVIQKYLRNEFQTIEQYNEQAGEIAEPYRFLVIADFPANFNEACARRLASIAGSGARCGVFTLIHRDPKQPLPPGIRGDDLRQGAARVEIHSDRAILHVPDLESWPLMLDAPPPDELLTRVLRDVGKAARLARRVEVPFQTIVPEASAFWTGDCSQSLRVALGRCGATKLQYLTLGEDTSQHALIAGKTGSGKSTLLHAMITNMALWYSPDQVEFYLIDFKKGVEFKDYATHQIPHVRAVAIESDREFGLSVLHGLDAELKRRGALFRDLGVQELAAYRQSPGVEPMPRTLLIIDEFQELFIEDDRIAQDAALLLDRLVRQGRAFGMHVILGSQTLGGAYSLARTTMGQMNVRIAMQCSEADSHLILSDDNSAARLLSRPGEAIYNDASGLVEGNSPFQVAWLSEAQREDYLTCAAAVANARPHRPLPPPVVFEGNAPADIGRNHLLEELIAAESRPSRPSAPRIWLGEAIAIKDPTAAEFRRQSGANMIIVGQRDDAALGMLAVSLASLAAQHDAASARFIILDPGGPDEPHAGMLARLEHVVPHQVRLVGTRDLAPALTELAKEVKTREDGNLADSPGIFLIINGLHRVRALRRSEDDFGFSTSDDGKPPSPDKLFAAILREGPAFGVHTIAWCDAMSSLTRFLDRQGLREFDYRVLFQMSAADSTTLIDTPLAAKLGARRALFYSEEHGQHEKFRPYAFPGDEWLASFAKRLGDRDGKTARPRSTRRSQPAT